MPKDKFVVYGDSRSGNYYKIKLLCSQLSIAYECCELDMLAGDTRTAEFPAMKANGKVPCLRCQTVAILLNLMRFLLIWRTARNWQLRTGSHLRQFRSGCFLNNAATSRIS